MTFRNPEIEYIHGNDMIRIRCYDFDGNLMSVEQANGVEFFCTITVKLEI